MAVPRVAQEVTLVDTLGKWQSFNLAFSATGITISKTGCTLVCNEGAGFATLITGCSFSLLN